MAFGDEINEQLARKIEDLPPEKELEAALLDSVTLPMAPRGSRNNYTLGEIITYIVSEAKKEIDEYIKQLASLDPEK